VLFLIYYNRDNYYIDNINKHINDFFIFIFKWLDYCFLVMIYMYGEWSYFTTIFDLLWRLNKNLNLPYIIFT